MNKYGKLRKPIVSYMISVIIIVLHTKFEASSLYSFWEIFDDFFLNGTSLERRRMKEQISQESPWSLTQLKSSLLHCILSLWLLRFIVPEKSLTKNSILVYIERKKNERIIEQISPETPLSLTQYKSSLHCIPGLKLLAFIIPEKSLTKIYHWPVWRERKMKEQMNK